MRNWYMKSLHKVMKKQIPSDITPRIKWVKRANSWAITTWRDGKQHIEFVNERPK